MKQIVYFVTFFAFYCSTYSVLAQTYYVSTTGNDTNNGTTEATAWRTIQKAANSATAGSTVYIKAGTYNEKIVMGINGTSGNYITFTHFGTDVVTIDGTGVSGTILLKIHNKSYLRIVGLHFTNCIGNDSQGILVDGTSHHKPKCYRNSQHQLATANCVWHQQHANYQLNYRRKRSV